MRGYALAFMLVILCCCSQSTSGSDAAQDYNSMVNGLIEFTSPAGMFQPDSMQCAHPHKLADRMSHYNTPGVSIAVVDGGIVAWTEAYGTLDVDVGTPVLQ